jgi:hypothetical protein
VGSDPGGTAVTSELDVRNLGGPTGGNNTWFSVFAGKAASVEVSGLQIVQITRGHADPLYLFRSQ